MILKKGKKIHKALKTIKYPNISHIKSVPVRHSKISSKLLKPIAQLKAITQELETIEKSNIVIKSVTKLSKPIKQPKVITQQPKNMKFYTKLK